MGSAQGYGLRHWCYIFHLLLGYGARGDVLRALLVPFNLCSDVFDVFGLHEHVRIVEIGDDKLSLRRGDVVEVKNVLLDRDVGGDHDAVDGGDHRRSFGEARSGEAKERVGLFYEAFS